MSRCDKRKSNLIPLYHEQVDNPEALNFRPKDMLYEVSHTILHFAHDPEFHIAVSESGYYKEGKKSSGLYMMRRRTAFDDWLLYVCLSVCLSVLYVCRYVK